MDSYSGRFPLDFFSFCLHMTSERKIEANQPQSTDFPRFAQNLSGRQHDDDLQLVGVDGRALHRGTRPLSNLAFSSDNTEESISTFADETLCKLAHLDPSLDITILSANDEGLQQGEIESSTRNFSESEALTSIQPKIQHINTEQLGTSRLFDPSTFDLPEEQQKKYFETDASEIEDVNDSAGAEGLTDRPSSSIVGFNLVPAPKKNSRNNKPGWQ